MKITNFHYPDATFPKGDFVEYPKWVHMSGYPSAIAKTAEEEASLLARAPVSGDMTVKLEGAQCVAVAAEPVQERKTLGLPRK